MDNSGNSDHLENCLRSDTRDCSCDSERDLGDSIQFIIEASPIATGIAVVILTLGITAAAILFIWLSFQYPDRANLLITAIAAPLGTALVMNAKNGAKAISKKSGEYMISRKKSKP